MSTPRDIAKEKKVDTRHKLKIYRCSNSKWKWAWYTNGRSIAVAGYFYDSPSAAKKAFSNLIEHIKKRVVLMDSLDKSKAGVFVFDTMTKVNYARMKYDKVAKKDNKDYE